VQEEYLDISTLEQRLQLVARTMASNKPGAQPAAGAMGSAVSAMVQPGMMQQGPANGLGPTGATMLAAPLGAAALGAAPAVGGIGMLPNAGIAPGADGALAPLQQAANPSTANGQHAADAGAQALLQGQLQQSIQTSQAPAGSAGAGAPQVMSNGVPVIRGSRAQGQQQVSAPRQGRGTPRDARSELTRPACPAAGGPVAQRSSAGGEWWVPRARPARLAPRHQPH
jgi:hypothetical protein